MDEQIDGWMGGYLKRWVQRRAVDERSPCIDKTSTQRTKEPLTTSSSWNLIGHLEVVRCFL